MVINAFDCELSEFQLTWMPMLSRSFFFEVGLTRARKVTHLRIVRQVKKENSFARIKILL